MSGQSSASTIKFKGFLAAWGLTAFGFGTSAYNWYLVCRDGSYYETLAIMTPFLGFLGLAALIAPGPEMEHGASSYKFRRAIGRAMIALGVAASVADFMLINGWVVGLPFPHCMHGASGAPHPLFSL